MLFNKKKMNLVMMTDCYNLGHQRMKTNTDYELSHIYNRSKDMLLFGFSDNINYFLREPIAHEDLDEAYEHSVKVGIRMPYTLFERVINEFKGYPPLAITTVPEGTWVPKGAPFAQIWNTEKGFGELVTWWEALLLWGFFPSSCATRSLQIHKYNEDTTPNFPRFHSFGFRAMGDEDRAIQASTAWALFNPSSDDFHISRYLPIQTIPALAHKVVQNYTSETQCMTNAIDAANYLCTQPHPAVSLVIDTYGSEKFIKEKALGIMKYAKKEGVYAVFRPDSGQVLEFAIKILKLAKENNLLDYCGTIIGDGQTFDSAVEGDKVLHKEGIDLHKMVWGIGAGFYKDFDRDYLGWSMKTAYSNGSDRMKFSDSPIKESLPGKIQVTYESEAGPLILWAEPFKGEWNDIPTGYESMYYYDSQSKFPKRNIPTRRMDKIKMLALKDIHLIYKRMFVINDELEEKKEKLRKIHKV